MTSRLSSSDIVRRSAYVPPQSPAPTQKRRRVWPWMLGVVVAFVLGVGGLMIAAAIFLPGMMRDGARPAPTSNVNTASTEQTQTEQTENVDTPPPTDEEQVLAQLTDIEHEWTAANLNADKQKLDRILADDYVSPSGPSGAVTRQDGVHQYHSARHVDPRSGNLTDLKVHLAGNRATLTGEIKYISTGGQEIELDFIDKFVWRNGRWQATGSEVKRKE